MGECTLSIADRLVLVSDGPPAAEFALFDSGDIELVRSEPGVVREAGYRSTAGEAIRRLEVAGVTLDLAEEAAKCLHGRTAEPYARGPVVRRLLPLLDAGELFDGGRYDAASRRYEGAFLDLPLLANDAGVAGGTAVLQALALVTFLSEVSREAPVVLSTLGHMEAVRLGERAARRRAIDGAAQVPRALRTLTERPSGPPPSSSRGDPARESLGSLLRARLRTCANPAARDHLTRLERSLADRARPAQGPLADPELWSLDRKLSEGYASHVLERVDAREAAAGREPGTIYLRSRAVLLLGREPARAIATRVAALAASMPDFPEVQLLAAQAWSAAGELRQALPFARDLLSNPRAPEELRAGAEAVLRGTRVPAPSATPEREPEAPPSSRAPTVRSATPISNREEAPRSAATVDTPVVPILPSPIPAFPPAFPSASGEPLDLLLHPERPTPDFAEEEPTPRTLTPPVVALRPGSDRRLLTPPERMTSPLPPRGSSSSAPPPVEPLARSVPWVAERTSASGPPTPRAPSPPPPGPGRVVQPLPWPAKMPAPREASVAPHEVERTPIAPRATPAAFMRGASMPPLANEPTALVPRPPVVPRVDVDEPELVETLSLPRGAPEGPPPSGIPRTPLEARVRFTHDARELARRYRLELGVELRVDPRAVVAIERQLVDHFPERTITTVEGAREAELHGALFSELLARLLGAEWADVSPSELGYWAMAVRTREGTAKRVWPFGRVLRLIASGGSDDLAGFYRRLRDLT